MRRFFSLPVLAICLMVGNWACAQSVSRKYALLIGLNNVLSLQSIPSLEYAVNDAEKLKEALKRQGYEVQILRNDEATRREILKRLLAFAARVNQNDTFLLFFAGHGLRSSINNKTYWLTYNTEITLLDGDGIRLAHLLDYVNDIRAKLKIVLLDHCFSGDLVLDISAATTTSRDATGTLDLVRGVAISRTELDNQLRVGGGTAVIAGALNAAREASEYKHGIFTAALLKALETTDADSNKDSQLSVSELSLYLRTEVETLAATLDVDQQVVDHLNVTNPGAEIIATNLGNTHAADRYKQVLDNWYAERERYGLSFRVKFLCETVLNEYRAAEGRVELLDERSQRIWREIADHIDALESPEFVPEAVSKDLNSQVEKILGN